MDETILGEPQVDELCVFTRHNLSALLQPAQRVMDSLAQEIDPEVNSYIRIVDLETGALSGPFKVVSVNGDITRLQDELEESNGLCRRLAQQAEGQQQKLAHAGSAKRELLAVAAEMHEWLTRS